MNDNEKRRTLHEFRCSATVHGLNSLRASMTCDAHCIVALRPKANLYISDLDLCTRIAKIYLQVDRSELQGAVPEGPS